jgi:hypothetical protein
MATLGELGPPTMAMRAEASRSAMATRRLRGHCGWRKPGPAPTSAPSAVKDAARKKSGGG